MSTEGLSPKGLKFEGEIDVQDDLIPSGDESDELDGEHCSICLQLYIDRTVIPDCSHEFCFDCIVTWADQSRRCPLCTRTIGPYLIHSVRSNYDYQKYHLPPLRSSPPPIRPLRPPTRRPTQQRRWGRRVRREQEIEDELERAIDRRRWVYHNHLYAKHVASNMFSRYRPCPSPAQFAASPDQISRATIFIRRELRVWVNLDVEFLTTFILSLMKAIDIRSESAIKLLAEFLDMDIPYSEGRRFPNAEHFAHGFFRFAELYSFLRSPYKSLTAYDENVQYDNPDERCRTTPLVIEQPLLPREITLSPQRPHGIPLPSLTGSSQARTHSPYRGTGEDRLSVLYESRPERSRKEAYDSNERLRDDLLQSHSGTRCELNRPVSSEQISASSNPKGKQRALDDLATDPVVEGDSLSTSEALGTTDVEAARAAIQQLEDGTTQKSLNLTSRSHGPSDNPGTRRRPRHPLTVAQSYLQKANHIAERVTSIKTQSHPSMGSKIVAEDVPKSWQANHARPTLLRRISNPHPVDDDHGMEKIDVNGAKQRSLAVSPTFTTTDSGTIPESDPRNWLTEAMHRREPEQIRISQVDDSLEDDSAMTADNALSVSKPQSVAVPYRLDTNGIEIASVVNGTHNDEARLRTRIRVRKKLDLERRLRSQSLERLSDNATDLADHKDAISHSKEADRETMLKMVLKKRGRMDSLHD